MTDSNRTEDWRVLCELAAKEQNPQKLIDLIMKINQALEESRRKRHDPVEAKIFSRSDLFVSPSLPAPEC